MNEASRALWAIPESHGRTVIIWIERDDSSLLRRCLTATSIVGHDPESEVRRVQQAYEGEFRRIDDRIVNPHFALGRHSSDGQ